jgi:hypothetical protein
VCSRATRGAALRRASVAAIFLFAPGACNERFEFDVPAAAGTSGGAKAGGPGLDNTGGMAGTAPPGAGASLGGASPGGASSGEASVGGASLGGASPGGAGSGGASLGGASPGGASSGSGAAIGGEGGGFDHTGPCDEGNACPSGLHCVDGACRACAMDSDCVQSGLARCDLTRYRCVACILSTDCADGFRCDALANRCLVGCQARSDCPETAHGCNTRRGVCFECDYDGECASSPLGSFCAVDGSGCVECRNDSDCDAALCDPLTGRCVECRDGLDCASGLCDPLAQTCLSGD